MFQWIGNNFMNILQSISIVIASITAIYGINAWRKELKGEKELDVAEEVLAIIYECKDNLEMIRSPFGYEGEGSTRKRRENETEEESKVLDKAYVLIERYEKYKDPFVKLQVIKYRFMALFGREKGAPFYEVNKIVNELFLAAKRLGSRYWNPKQDINQVHDENWYERMAAEEAKFWSGEDPDDISERMNDVVKQLEEMCSPIIFNEKYSKRKR